MSGNLQMGIVNSYDPVTCTAEVTSYDGLHRYYNAGISMSSYDNANGIYSYTPPSIGAPCLFTVINGEAMIITQYAPPNLGYASDTASSTSATVSRAVDEMATEDQHLPGDWQLTSQSGAEVYLRNMVFGIKMNPLFYSVWNLLNNVWDTMCNVFKFSSPAADMLVDFTEGGATNVGIQVRSSVSQRDGVPSIDLQLGADAGVLLLKINGTNLCHIDENKNISLHTKNITISADVIKMSGSLLDCKGMGRVKMPR